MGLFRVSGRLAGPAGRSEDVDFLADTGATLVVLPRALADRLGLAPRRQHTVVLAGGTREVWPVAEVHLQLNGDEVTTPCFIALDGPPLLGAVALESLFLAVDPVRKQLVPLDAFAGRIRDLPLDQEEVLPAISASTLANSAGWPPVCQKTTV
jgi:predicted aspartyl protease